jgi:DNA (cytosine-5)-methyltransferase 1
MSGMKPVLLDLFCGAGGCAVGYARAGFDVVGVDKEPQPNYPFEFIQADALEFIDEKPPGWLDIHFDAIHASPPCQAFSVATLFHGRNASHVDLVDEVRWRLDSHSLPWVIENVPGAPIQHDVLLCGEMFGLGVHRHRYFETRGFFVMQPPHGKHRLKGAPTNSAQPDGYARLVAGHFADLPGASDAMGIDWMTREELAQAIPPAYTEHIGEFLRKAVSFQIPEGDDFEEEAA